MGKRLKFRAVYKKHDGWHIGYVPEVPGVNAQERTLKATRESLTSALRELAEIDPDAVSGRKRRIEDLEIVLSS